MLPIPAGSRKSSFAQQGRCLTFPKIGSHLGNLGRIFQLCRLSGCYFSFRVMSPLPECRLCRRCVIEIFHSCAYGRWLVKATSMAVAVLLAAVVSSIGYAQNSTGSYTYNSTRRGVQIMPAVGFAPDDYSPPKAQSYPTCACEQPTCREKHCGIVRPLQNCLSTCLAQPAAGACTGCKENPCSVTTDCHERHCGIIKPLHSMMSGCCGACEVHAKPTCSERHCGVITPLKGMLAERCEGGACGCRCGYGCLSCAPLYAYFLDQCGGGNAGAEEGCHCTAPQQGCCSSH
jgi:hypothetical protein